MPDGAWIKDTTVKKATRGNIIDDLLTPVLCSAIAPVRPHAYILSYNGRRHQSIRGNHQFFEANQTKVLIRVAGALDKIKSFNTSSNIYVVLCGPMTPAQKTIVRNKSVLNTSFYLNLLRWFKAHHAGFTDVELECPESNHVEDAESPHNTNKEGDSVVEKQGAIGTGVNVKSFSSKAPCSSPC